MADQDNDSAGRRPVLCVGGLAWRDDQLLLVRRGHGPAAGEWSIPGGHVEYGESLPEALVREFSEETGLDVVVDELVGWAEQIDPAAHLVIFDFAVTVLDDDQIAVAGSDAAEVRWVDVGELNDLRLVDGLVEFLDAHGLLDDFGDDALIVRGVSNDFVIGGGGNDESVVDLRRNDS